MIKKLMAVLIILSITVTQANAFIFLLALLAMKSKSKNEKPLKGFVSAKDFNDALKNGLEKYERSLMNEILVANEVLYYNNSIIARVNDKKDFILEARENKKLPLYAQSVLGSVFENIEKGRARDSSSNEFYGEGLSQNLGESIIASFVNSRYQKAEADNAYLSREAKRIAAGSIDDGAYLVKQIEWLKQKEEEYAGKK